MGLEDPLDSSEGVQNVRWLCQGSPCIQFYSSRVLREGFILEYPGRHVDRVQRPTKRGRGIDVLAERCTTALKVDPTINKEQTASRQYSFLERPGSRVPLGGRDVIWFCLAEAQEERPICETYLPRDVRP
jgi:hypothetical protein